MRYCDIYLPIHIQIKYSPPLTLHHRGNDPANYISQTHFLPRLPQWKKYLLVDKGTKGRIERETKVFLLLSVGQYLCSLTTSGTCDFTIVPAPIHAGPP